MQQYDSHFFYCVTFFQHLHVTETSYIYSLGYSVRQQGVIRFTNLYTQSTTHQTVWTLYRSYFKGISANIEQQVYSVTCCRPYISPNRSGILIMITRILSKELVYTLLNGSFYKLLF
jgi:hypothetical protein